MERMKVQINRRIEQILLDVIQILDTHTGKDDKQIVATDTILKGSVIESEEDIDEKIKAKFLTRLIVEYRRNRERAKQDMIREQIEKEIEENIYKRFPSLGNSPERGSRSGNNSLLRYSVNQTLLKNAVSPGQATLLNQSKTHKKANMSIGGVEVEDITHMKRGWGVSQKKPNMKSTTMVTPTGKALKPPPQVKVNHFKPAKNRKQDDHYEDQKKSLNQQ